VSASGAVSGRRWWAINAAILLVFSFVLTSCDSVVSILSPTPTPDIEPQIINIEVIDQENQAIDSAIVRVQGTLQVDDNDNNGYWIRFCITGQTISVWAPGYALQWQDCSTGLSEYKVTLYPLAATNNLTYSWLSAQNCSGCHSSLGDRNEFNEWQLDGHSRVFTNQFFWTMYTGTDVSNNQSDRTSWEILSTGQRVRQTHDTRFGPGFLLDYPNDQGNCAYCHVPALIQGGMQAGQLRDVIGNLPSAAYNAITEGVTCDICHKVIDVAVVDGQQPYSDRPGVLSFSSLLPDPGTSFMLGPTDNVAETLGKYSCAPVFSESRFCAACHYGKFAETLVYSSYSEWLETRRYSERVIAPDGVTKIENPDYRSCQDCHMLSTEEISATLHSNRSACSVANSSIQNFNHNMMKYEPDPANPSKYIPTMIQNAATLNVEYVYNAGANNIEIIVKVVNAKAGHKFPTDSPLRHLLLMVEAKDELGNVLPLANGSTIPVWGGVDKNVLGMEDYGGLPGKIFALVLADKDTSAYPTAAYWNPTKLVTADNRLVPFVPDESRYSFSTPADMRININVRLVYRYAFVDLAAQKGWSRDDVLVVSKECRVEANDTAPVPCQ